MKYYLDSAKIEEIDYAYKFYGIDGVTTNPNHIRNSGKPFLVAINDIANWLRENNLEGKDEFGFELFPVSVEINPHLDNYLDMMKAAREIASISPNFVIKLPCNIEGCKAAKLLEEEGIRTNVTLVFSPTQAIQAARINARYVSPFIGWKEGAGDEGIDYVKEIVQIYKEYGYGTEIICAAVRNGRHIVECAKVGADIVTCGLQVYEDALTHPFTDFGLAKFQDAWDHTEGN